MAEHDLTVVRRDYRGHGIAYALKRAQLAWASRAGVRQLVTWTLKGNEPMQTLNRRLGYVDHARALIYTAPLASLGTTSTSADLPRWAPSGQARGHSPARVLGNVA